jgi:hypothetical protein
MRLRGGIDGDDGWAGFFAQELFPCSAPWVPFCTEFWPNAYRLEGTFEEILEIIPRRFFGLVSLGERRPHARPAREVLDWAVWPTAHTDLFLVPWRHG